MRQTWRWFGPVDKVTIADARQAGAEGVLAERGQTDRLIEALEGIAEKDGNSAALTEVAEGITTISELMVRQDSQAQEKERDRLRDENAELRRRLDRDGKGGNA